LYTIICTTKTICNHWTTGKSLSWEACFLEAVQTITSSDART